MSAITYSRLEQTLNQGHTMVDNIFTNMFAPCLPDKLVCIYHDALMRCFGDSTEHFYSTSGIAKHLCMDERTLRRHYEMFDRIKAHFPEHPQADEDGYIWILKREERWLKVHPNVLREYSETIFRLEQKSKKGTITTDEKVKLKETKQKKAEALSGFSEKHGDYKYQSTNHIRVMVDFKTLPDKVIREFQKKAFEENTKTAQKLLMRYHESWFKDTDPDEDEVVGGDDECVTAQDIVSDDESGHNMYGRVNSPTHNSPENIGWEGESARPLREGEFARQISTRDYINNYKSLKSVSQSKEKAETKNQKTDGQTDGSSSESWWMIRDNLRIDELKEVHPAYSKQLDEIYLNIMDMYYSEYISVSKQNKPRAIVHSVLHKLEQCHIMEVIRKWKKQSELGQIHAPKKYLQSMIFNVAMEYDNKIDNDVISDMNSL